MARRPHPDALEMFGRLDQTPGARPAEPEHDARPAPEPDDCAVAAAVLRDWFGEPQRRKERAFVTLVGEDWPRCDWSGWGFDLQDGPSPPRSGAAEARRRTSIALDRPDYDSGGALITASLSLGPGLGHSAVLPVRRDDDGWWLDGARFRSIS
jgi:hypothetical protein